MKKKASANFADPNKDKVIISSEYFEDTRPSYICSICNQTLIRLTDSSMQNTAFWCRNCSVEFDPESENVRRESKLSVPERNVEPAVGTTPSINEDSVAIRHQPEIKGGLKELQKKGLKITHYEERKG
jgi:DNA-directed RNA polymerase subunit RPC12/RpoP